MAMTPAERQRLDRLVARERDLRRELKALRAELRAHDHEFSVPGQAIEISGALIRTSRPK